MSSSDWSSIRAAYEAGQHAVVAFEGGHQARNPGQRWSTRFDGRGFTTEPDAGGWTWGLELSTYGFTGQERPISGFATVKTDGGRIECAWDAHLTEWYVNDNHGLEHGYTIRERPAPSEGPLTLTLVPRGSLRPRVQAGGRGVTFVNDSGAPALTYSGLTVTDADRRILPAQFESLPHGFHVKIDDHGARYPLTVDPIAQQAYLKASNTDKYDFFGCSVAISGNTVVVGAPQESGNAIGVNGTPLLTSMTFSGAAYVFVRNGTSWSQQAYLKASNTGILDHFGASVAISGDTIVIGATGEGSSATGVNGNQLDNTCQGSGAVYIFVRTGTTWSQQAYVKASNTGASDSFGAGVSVCEDTVVVGAPIERSNATGVNGNQLDNSAPFAGAAYVFVRSGLTWSQQAYLKASNTDAYDHFGTVSVSGDTIVVGARFEGSSASGVNGNQFDNSAPESGAAYIFVRNGSIWSQQAYLKASNTGAYDIFASSVAVSGDTVVVGAVGEASSATGVNGNTLDNSALYAGAAYIFVRSGSSWSQQAYVKASNTDSGDEFGVDVAVSADLVVVGAYGEMSNATGVNGNQLDNNARRSGAAYVFVRNGSTWIQQAYLKASNTEAYDEFAISVAVSGDTVVVGAIGEDSNAKGVNGNQQDDTAAASGAAYTFDLDNKPGTASYGTGSPGCSGIQTLDVNHAPMVNSPAFAITCRESPPSSLGIGLVADTQDLTGSDPFNIAVLVHIDVANATELFAVDFVSDAVGNGASRGTSIPNYAGLIGKTYYAQAFWAWTSCPLPPFNLSSSRGLALTIQAP